MAHQDLAAVLAIQQQCYLPAFHEPLVAFESKWAASPDTCWVAEQQGQVCAYLVCLPIEGGKLPALHASAFQRSITPDWLYLHDLAIGPQARGTGLAPMLVSEALTRAKDLGLQQAGLVAVQDSSAFWSRFGFAINESGQQASGEKLASFGTGAVFMSRPID
ncbi:MAG TPA: GNAT family N-acetyltransferase [Aquabacterium sp.]|uniref:GNAT family N-acetyltransferase n=1 Tax=Aquabacterium sp. TaxID=1872578 RepID=UPI002E333140|nr:GNAT family N-acetyltransferase [Aquabacterium sp.]HEX5356417.1 GNAT family N-acetyltransferase [Aquabacterium sp.]